MSNSLRPHGLYSPWNSPGQNTGAGSLSLTSPGDLPKPGMEPKSPALQAGSLPDEPQGKPKNTGVGNLSLLQRIFLTQEWNRGLLHCSRFFTNWAIREAKDMWKYTEQKKKIHVCILICQLEGPRSKHTSTSVCCYFNK